ncbi:MAG TPA: 6-phosphogluconolactonase [Pyrinomonadaceae bacterium]|nr:6-phosphogluconolactonase [Pyrinomonadaceae bacterium]
MSSSPCTQVFASAEEIADAAAQQFVELANERQGRFAVALAGGTTPRRTYELLAGKKFRDHVEWSKVHLFFGDERCVRQDHPDSNYRMAHEALISQVDIPHSNVHPINGHGDPATNAAHYEAELREYFRNSTKPAFDLVLLGLGEDGHTASLFPQTEALGVTERWVIENWVEKLQSYRITLTVPAINSGAHVTFLVAGANKAPAVSGVLNGRVQTENLPAQLIKPEAGTLTWLLDSRAASLLQKD